MLSRIFFVVISFVLSVVLAFASVDVSGVVSVARRHAAVSASLYSPAGVSFRAGVYAAATPSVVAAVTASVAAGESPVVVCDVDETLLDSSAAQFDAAVLGFSADRYSSWCVSGLPAVPGAVDFVSAVRSSGARVVFVTARPASDIALSAAGLRAAGFACDNADVICCVSSRAKASVFSGLPGRIVAFVGDSPRDFGSVPGAIRVVLPNVWYGPDLSGSGLLHF